MKTMPIIFLASILLALVTGPAAAQNDPHLAVLTSRNLDVQICGPRILLESNVDQCRAAVDGERLWRGDIIRTGSGGRARVINTPALDPDRRIVAEIGPESGYGLNIDRIGQDRAPDHNVFQGIVRFTVETLTTKRFARRPVIVGGMAPDQPGCGVRRGTDFIVQRDPANNQWRFLVTKGLIVCGTPDGQSHEVGPGNKLEVNDERGVLSKFAPAEWDKRVAVIAGGQGINVAQACSPQQMSGTYGASWGPIICEPDGAGLICCYGGSCKWSLRLALSDDGRKLEGIWDHNDGRTGPVEFGLTEFCELSSGRYGYSAGQLTQGWPVTSKLND